MQSVLTSFSLAEFANISLLGSERLTRFPDSSVGRIGSPILLSLLDRKQPLIVFFRRQGSNSSLDHQCLATFRLPQPVRLQNFLLFDLRRCSSRRFVLVVSLSLSTLHTLQSLIQYSRIVRIRFLELTRVVLTNSVTTEFAHVYYRRHYEGGGRTI
jgi:hypothetical protein